MQNGFLAGKPTCCASWQTTQEKSGLNLQSVTVGHIWQQEALLLNPKTWK